MRLKVELTDRELLLTTRGVKKLASDTHYQALRYDHSEIDRYHLAALSGELGELAGKLDKIYKEKCKNEKD